MVRLFVTLLLLAPEGRAYDDACRSWFEKAHLKRGSHCLLACAATTEDMGSIGCSDRCSYLCAEPIGAQFTFKLSALYGLNMSERALVAKEPSRMISAYTSGLHAEKLCSLLYKSSLTNDESDACRHFVWAALLTKEFGVDFATQVLNAHEEQADQPAEERAMDLANNRLGQLAVQSLKDQSDQGILDLFRSNLKKKALVVLKPLGRKNERVVP